MKRKLSFTRALSVNTVAYCEFIKKKRSCKLHPKEEYKRTQLFYKRISVLEFINET